MFHLTLFTLKLFFLRLFGMKVYFEHKGYALPPRTDLYIQEYLFYTYCPGIEMKNKKLCIVGDCSEKANQFKKKFLFLIDTKKKEQAMIKVFAALGVFCLAGFFLGFSWTTAVFFFIGGCTGAVLGK